MPSPAVSNTPTCSVHGDPIPNLWPNLARAFVEVNSTHGQYCNSIPTTNSGMSDIPEPSISPNSGSSLRDKQGWDGKLRMGKKAVVTNAHDLSDPEYSDEDAPPLEQIAADEGRCLLHAQLKLR